MTGDKDRAREYSDRAISMARKTSNDMHGHALYSSGVMLAHLDELDTALERLRLSTGLLVHSLDRQRAFFHMGELAHRCGMEKDAKLSLTSATRPSTETYHGRMAVQKLREIVGLKLI